MGSDSYINDIQDEPEDRNISFARRNNSDFSKQNPDAERNFKHWVKISQESKIKAFLKSYDPWNIKIYDQNPQDGTIDPKYVALYFRKNGIPYGSVINFHQPYPEYLKQISKFFQEKFA